MTEKHEKLLEKLEFRIQQLIYLCDSLKAENKSLKDEILLRDEQIGSISAKCEELQSKYNDLEFANTFTTSDSESVEVAKKRLSKLVQEVDKCISLLK